MHIKIGTRGSKLALWQANMVASKLQEAGASTEVITIETKGDKILDRSLASIGSKGLFTEEIEQQLQLGHIDIAVHSAKDMQSTLPEGMHIIAFTERENASDVLVSMDKTLSLASGLPVVVGTSSARRKEMLRHHYPHLTIVEMRGNLQTRIKKMQDGACQAMILAYAGIHRMEYDHLINEILNPEVFVPPVGQGCVAIEAHTSLAADKATLITATLNHSETAICVKEERKLLKALDGGCSIPLFCMATLANQKLEMRAGLIYAAKGIHIEARDIKDIDMIDGCVQEILKQLESQNIHEVLREIRASSVSH